MNKLKTKKTIQTPNKPHTRSTAYGFILLITAAVLLIGVFSTLKPSSAIEIVFEIDPDESVQQPSESKIYPGLINASGRCILDGDLVDIIPDTIVESHSDTFYSLYVQIRFPDPFFHTVSNRVVFLLFNLTISNATIKVNNMQIGDLNSPIDYITTNGALIEIGLKSGTSFNVVVETILPAGGSDEDDL